jgi:uridine phosphorylase
VDAAKNLGQNWHAGIVQSKDSFYGQHSPQRMPSGFELNNKWEAWLKAGCLASEMECAALFIVSQIIGARAGCVLNVLWNQEREKAGMSNPHSLDTEPAIKTAVEAIRILLERG